MQEYPALRLSTLDKRYADLLNAFSERSLPETFNFGAAKGHLRLCRETPIIQRGTTLTFSVNGALWNLIVGEPRALMAHPMFAKKEAFGFTPEMLPAELKTALNDVLFAPLTKVVSETLGATVLFEDRKEGAATNGTLQIGWVVTLEAAHMEPLCFNAILSTSSGASASMLLSLLKALPKRKDSLTGATLEAIGWRLDVLGASLVLSQEEFKTLGTGDILMPPEWLPEQNKVTLRLVCGTRPLEASCELAANAATLTSPFTPILEQNMSESTPLEVKLSFVLENRVVTLGELQSMGPGYAFTLTSDTTSPVTLCANDKPIARGRLVEINGAVGVQVTEML